MNLYGLAARVELISERYRKYSLPSGENGTDKQKLMYDFYVLTYLKYALTMPSKNFRDLPESLVATVNDAVDTLYPALREELLNAVFYSVCAEIRHAMGNKRNFELFKGDPGQGKEGNPKYHKLWMSYLRYMKSKDINTDIEKEIYFDKTPKSRTRAPETEKDNNHVRNNSFKAAHYAMKETGATREDFVKMCAEVYRRGAWNTSYGGEAWARICDGYVRLNAADKVKTDNDPRSKHYKEDMGVAIDHVYDLQHNTDTVFNKLKSYLKDGSYNWLKKALDHKANVKSYYELLKLSSPFVRQIAPPILYNKLGQTWEKESKYESPNKGQFKSTSNQGTNKSEENLNIEPGVYVTFNPNTQAETTVMITKVTNDGLVYTQDMIDGMSDEIYLNELMDDVYKNKTAKLSKFPPNKKSSKEDGSDWKVGDIISDTMSGMTPDDEDTYKIIKISQDANGAPLAWLKNVKTGQRKKFPRLISKLVSLDYKKIGSDSDTKPVDEEWKDGDIISNGVDTLEITKTGQAKDYDGNPIHVIHYVDQKTGKKSSMGAFKDNLLTKGFKKIDNQSNKLKVGDKVKNVNSGNVYKITNISDEGQPEEYELTSVLNGGSYWTTGKNLKAGTYEIIPSKTNTSEHKVGDYFENKYDHQWYYLIKDLPKFGSKNYSVTGIKKDDFSSTSGNSFNLSDDELSHMKYVGNINDKKSEELPLKVGDTKILNQNKPTGTFKVGDTLDPPNGNTVKIIDVNPDGTFKLMAIAGAFQGATFTGTERELIKAGYKKTENSHISKDEFREKFPPGSKIYWGVGEYKIVKYYTSNGQHGENDMAHLEDLGFEQHIYRTVEALTKGYNTGALKPLEDPKKKRRTKSFTGLEDAFNKAVEASKTAHSKNPNDGVKNELDGTFPVGTKFNWKDYPQWINTITDVYKDEDDNAWWVKYTQQQKNRRKTSKDEVSAMDLLSLYGDGKVEILDNRPESNIEQVTKEFNKYFPVGVEWWWNDHPTVKNFIKNTYPEGDDLYVTYHSTKDGGKPLRQTAAAQDLINSYKAGQITREQGWI